ncbi:hypothetical protein C2845_PM05G02410 [Panicum miliaceum]|uniref:Uncharacterized protein n=1 Tax=Panicum miliaceum TaxID=4540 RepID=A0A3L6T0N1_PANMI|nr:hypothetical protein C2845_PM05G02410 [Panicum miliaceum]
MAWSSLLKTTAALLPHLRCAPPASAAPSLLRGHVATASSATTPRGLSSSTARQGGVVENPPPGMAPLPDDAPRQTPPRLGKPDPAGPPTPTSSGDKMGGETSKEGEAPAGMPDTAPAPDVPVPPVSPDDSNV